jgi:hypothetical protein
MDLKELIKLQKEFDKEHGFSNKYSRFLLMGVTLSLLGECGELANLIKKIFFQKKLAENIHS